MTKCLSSYATGSDCLRLIGLWRNLDLMVISVVTDNEISHWPYSAEVSFAKSGTEPRISEL